MRRKIKAKITRTVTEVAIVVIDEDGCVEDIHEILYELDTDNIDVLSEIEVLDEY